MGYPDVSADSVLSHLRPRPSRQLSVRKRHFHLLSRTVLNAGLPDRGGRRAKSQGLKIVTTHRSMFDGGLGLPIAAIGWSIVISFAGCWAWLESAHFWAYLASGFDKSVLAEGYVGNFIAAAFALLAQWTANFVILRIRNGQSRWLWASYAICALYAAVSLHHVHEAMAAPAWRAEVAARAAERAPDLTIIETNDRFISEARARLTALTADTVSRRNESVSGPLTEAMTQAEASSIAARARLAEAPALPSSRPLNLVDFIVGVIAAALALLEFTLYWGMGGAPKRPVAGAGTGAGTGEATTDELVQNLKTAPAKKSGPTPVPEAPIKLAVDNLAFDTKGGAANLLNELIKAGVVNEFDLRSKVNQISANRRYSKDKIAA